ncbi:MAG: hypothetical protein ABI132_06920 [Rhodanobacteraceae bacterium]
MQNRLAVWVLPALCIAAGIALVFVRVDNGKSQKAAKTHPGLTLLRFASVRYAMAATFIVLGVIAHFVPE